MWDDINGCGKQHLCAGNTLYFLSLLTIKHGIIMHHAIGSHGHEKYIVDGINAIDKEFLHSTKMCMVGMPESSNGDKRMAAHSTVEGALRSLAQEALRLCADALQMMGVKLQKSILR